MNRRVLVLGAQGMLGHTVFRHLKSLGESVRGTQFRDPAAEGYLDAAAAPESWHPLIRDHEYLINCVGILKSAMREDDTRSLALAIRVNALFPHLLAQAAAEMGARVIHVSTDGVYSGREKPYSESDAPDCRDQYGRSKALGESAASNVINLRCSIVGRDPYKHKGLLEGLLLQPNGSHVPGFQNHLWNGVTTPQLARLVEVLIERDGFDRVRANSAVLHFCPNPAITKYELLRLWQRATGAPVTVSPMDSPEPLRRLLATEHGCPTAILEAARSWPELLDEITSSSL